MENINENHQFELGDKQNAWMTASVREDHAKSHKISQLNRKVAHFTTSELGEAT